MRGIRWAVFGLYLEGLVTISVGRASQWVDFGSGHDLTHDLDFRSWLNGHLVSNIGAGAGLLGALIALCLVGLGAYWFGLLLLGRLSIPQSEIAGVGVVSAAIAIIGLGCTAYMTVRTYGYAAAWVPPEMLERGDAPIPHATVTVAPWLVLGGSATFIAAGLWLSRTVRDWRREELERRR